ncbi:cardiolipin synthase B [Oxalicibacterium flavum]|uniref:Cardiolipin synthase n=1 Tax=Oxalicibacterium flavum TaxID=179467 RepID=A0A8J2XYJ7_9BURK|nr:cardiolipin synthase [Oxalicibacterium flavum]GGB98814.1 cardiolipin synthase B [Oxalicibacterium flavum]
MRTRIIWKDRSRKSKILIILGSVLTTLVVVLLALNLTLGEKKIREDIPRLYSVADPQFERTMGVLLGPAIVGGNRAQALQNGEEIFPAMLEAIRGAQKTINFETYIYWSEAIGKEFAEAFAERARAGVKVHVLIDWVGSSKMEQSYLDLMEAAGVEVRKYHPLKWYNLARMNNRTHRKLLVVDGRIGFTGGVGIAGQWTGHAQDPDHWRDSHYRVEGPVVAQMQAVAIDNWIKTTGHVLDGPDYFPELKPVGDDHAQVFSSSPQGGSESMRLMYLLALTAAQKSIQLAVSYFVPDEMTRRVLIDAARRGVKVQIIVPGEHMDVEVVRRSSRGMWGELLQAGIEIYEYEPTMYHCKVMIVDDLMVSVGSTNFDDRSFRMNDEANLNVYNAAFARDQVAVFNDDLRHAHRITYEEWRNRPWTEKLHEQAARLLAPLL